MLLLLLLLLKLKLLLILGGHKLVLLVLVIGSWGGGDLGQLARFCFCRTGRGAGGRLVAVDWRCLGRRSGSCCYLQVSCLMLMWVGADHGRLMVIE